MQLSELVTEVSTVISSCQYKATDTDIKMYLNQGLQFAAGLVAMHGLQTTDTIAVTSTGTLPTDKGNHDVFLAELSDGNHTKLKKHDTFSSFADTRRKGCSSGTPEHYYCVGTTIHVTPEPSSSTDIIVYYHAVPDTLTNDADIPEGIEAYLHSPVLANYAAAQIFGINNDLSRYNSHTLLFQAALALVKKDERPAEDDLEYVTDDGEYIE